METATPGQEFMSRAFRLLALDLDAHFLKALYDITTLDEVLRTPVHIHVVDLLVELLGIGEHTVIGSLQIQANLSMLLNTMSKVWCPPQERPAIARLSRSVFVRKLASI